MKPRWLLPEHVEDILPPYARQAEDLRRQLLDLYDRHGYDLVSPPLIEYLDSLLTGAAHDLDLKTFKVVDGLSGRMLGIRADMTPQAARIDAHLLNRQGATRLCYAGPVLHTRPAGLLSSRVPYQLGAELFGHAGIEADLEILGLLTDSLRLAQLPAIRVSLGHVGLFRAMKEGAGLDDDAAHELFRALRGKDVPSLRELTADLAAPWREAFLSLPELYGDATVLDRAANLLPDLPGITSALNDLGRLMARGDGAELTLDLADLRGYGYHNGVVFAAYAGGQARAVAAGGRYDGAGAMFGRTRPATGFSLDLRAILDSMATPPARGGILAPPEAANDARVAELRAAGERVVVELPGQAAHRQESGCDRLLVRDGADWRVQPIA
jgi:ATP phosphoribosyltransferase regulatory subunit